MRLLRKEPELDPATKRGLAALDAALEGRSVDDQDRELVELASTLRSDRPVPHAEFLEALDRQVDDGFRRLDESGKPDRRVSWHDLRRFLLPAMAGAAAVTVVAVSIGSSGVFSGNGQDGATTAEAPTLERQAGGDAVGRAEETEGTAPMTVAPDSDAKELPVFPRGDDVTRPRRVERAATLTLAALPSKIEDVSDEAVAIVDRYRGFVLSSSISSGSQASQGARMEIRVPARNAQAALADLSGLAHVRQRTQDTDDVTAQFSSLEQRTERLQRRGEDLRERITASGSSTAQRALRNRLAIVNGELSALRAQERSLNERVQYSTLSLAVVPDADAGSDGNLTPSGALDDAGEILGAMVGVTLIGLAIAVPLVIAGSILWLLGRGLLRRRREGSLDESPRPGAEGR